MKSRLRNHHIAQDVNKAYFSIQTSSTIRLGAICINHNTGNLVKKEKNKLVNFFQPTEVMCYDVKNNF